MVRKYPQAVIEILDDDIQYPTAVIKSVERFAASSPWQGSLNTRKKKFQLINRDLASACNIEMPTLGFGLLDGGSSGASHYTPIDHRIIIVGKLSVVTFLHEFAHALGMDEQDACRWSINLFRKCFPRQYSRLIHFGHTLVRTQDISKILNRESVR